MVGHGDREHLLGARLADDVLVQVLDDLARRRDAEVRVVGGPVRDIGGGAAFQLDDVQGGLGAGGADEDVRRRADAVGGTAVALDERADFLVTAVAEVAGFFVKTCRESTAPPFGRYQLQ